MIRFGSNHKAKHEEAPAGEPAAAATAEATPAPDDQSGGRELFVRHARKDGRLVAVLRAVDFGDGCTVEAEVYPTGTTQMTRPGPYTFGDAHQASAFVTEAVAALMYLGCDIQAH